VCGEFISADLISQCAQWALFTFNSALVPHHVLEGVDKEPGQRKCRRPRHH